MTEIKRPEIFRGVMGNCEVRFAYTFRDGESGRITGHFDSFIVKDGKVDGIRVRLGSTCAAALRHQAGIAKALEKDRHQPVASFAAGRIEPDAETGLIIPVSKKELASGTGAARFIRTTGRQVAYALDLAGQVPADAAIERPDEAQFRRMSRRDLSEWIDLARFEIEHAKGAAPAAGFRGEDD